MRELIKGVWRGIGHSIGLKDIVVNFPLWDTVNVCLCDVEEVGGNIDRKHCFFIDFIESEAGIFTLISCGRCENRVESNRSRLIVVAN